jgi:hypothetical protein
MLWGNDKNVDFKECRGKKIKIWTLKNVLWENYKNMDFKEYL